MEISGETTICAHNIKWRYFRGDVQFHLEELPECEEDHIRGLLNQNYREGQLYYVWNDENGVYRELSGWWNIEN